MIDYTKQNFTAAREQYDIILDNVSTHSLSAMRGALRPNGRLVIVGSVSHARWLESMIRPLKAAAYSLFTARRWARSTKQTQADLDIIGDLMRAGK